MIYFLCDHPQQQLQVGVRLRPDVTFVCAAAGVADVVLDTLVRHDFVGATVFSVHAALRRQDVDGAVAACGAGAALIRQTLACDVGAGLAFLLQRTVITQQAVKAPSREDQSSCGQQDGGQKPAWSQQMDTQTDVNPHS